MRCCIALLLLAFVAADELINYNTPEREVTLGPEDFANAEGAEDPVQPDGDPTLKANKFEGDIAGHNASSIAKFIADSNYLGRNAIKNQYQRWPDGIIPYTLSSKYGPRSRRTIASAMEEFHKRTCIRFRPRNNERNYVFIHPDDGCYSLVGRVGGRQPLSLDGGCISKGTIMHELMHASGFFHEQSRADRDKYITIIERNLQPDAMDQFTKYSLRQITHLGTEYDYGSIMHYSQYAFSKNGRITIVATNPEGQNKMGNRKDFSKNDVYKLNKLYNCEDKLDENDVDGEDGAEGDCEDDHWNCRIRRALGYCDYDRETQSHCKKTCNRCGLTVKKGTTTKKPPTTRRPSRPPSVGSGDSDCEDKKQKCSEWADKNYCAKFTKYMRANCPMACGHCGRSGGNSNGGVPKPPTEKPEEDPKCKDKNHHCGDWMQNNGHFCTDYPRYMKKNCMKSCGFCGRERDTDALGRAAGTSGDCTDSHRKCAQYKEDGYCEASNRNYRRMQRRCKKSCGFC